MSDSFRTLAKKLLDGKNVTLEYQRFNDGTEEKLDVLINRVHASIDLEGKDIVVYLSKENDNTIFSNRELYRLSIINDLDVLQLLLKEAKKQGHT